MFSTSTKRVSGLLLPVVLLAFGDAFRADDVKIVGDLQYGDKSDAIDCTGTPRYSALVFNANSGDRVDVTVTAEGHRAEVAIADPSLNEIAKGTTHLTAVLPNRGPDIEAYYIVFRDSEAKPAKFVVELKKVRADQTSK